MTTSTAAKAKTRTATPKEKAKANQDSQESVESDGLDDERARLAEDRNRLGLTTRPFATLRLFFSWMIGFAAYSVTKALKSPITWLVVVPSLVGWIATKRVLAPHLFKPPVCGDTAAGILWSVELAMTEVLWWTILGILSSVGFGTGLHSGVMFLFPHVMQVVAAAEGCGTTDGLIAWYHHPCKLECVTTHGPKDGGTVTFVRLFSLVWLQCVLWGIGTACGELPPYLVSKGARLAGQKDSEFEAELEEARHSRSLFARLKVWTIDFTEKNGFLGVFLLASWPNAAFDMCGMCCGYLLMPFWTFFLACCLGKGVVKVSGQAAFFIMLFGSAAFDVLLSFLARFDATLAPLVGKDLQVRTLVAQSRAKIVRQFEQQSRFHPEKLLLDGQGHLDIDALKMHYGKFDDHEAVVDRVLGHLDKDADGRVALEELRAAASDIDGKISLSSLDPGKGTSIAKLCWELFIVGLIAFFLCSVITQLAKTKQAEIDEAKLEQMAREKQKKK